MSHSTHASFIALNSGSMEIRISGQIKKRSSLQTKDFHPDEMKSLSHHAFSAFPLIAEKSFPPVEFSVVGDLLWTSMFLSPPGILVLRHPDKSTQEGKTTCLSVMLSTVERYPYNWYKAVYERKSSNKLRNVKFNV